MNKTLCYMNKILCCICIISLFSCSKDDPAPSSNVLDFEITRNTSSRAEWNNIQTGDVLPFNIKVNKFDTLSNVVYVLKPISVDATKHQINTVDYYFQEMVKIKKPYGVFNSRDSISVRYNRDSIIIKKPTSSFYVSILKPGNFILQYELCKMIDKKYVSKETQEVSFSAVTIDVYTWHQQTDGSSIFDHSNHSRYYEFTIDDGDQSNDTYLTNSEVKINTYIADYNGNKYPGDILINTPLTFSNRVDTESGPQAVPNDTLKQIKITQKIAEQLDNIIYYNNLIIQRDENR